MKKKIILFLSIFISIAAVAPQYEIVFFFAPKVATDSFVAPTPSEESGPMHVAASTKSKRSDPNAHKGVLVEYAGYWTASDQDGKISLLREQTDPEMYIIVSNKVKPVINHGQTVDYFVYDKNKAAIYTIALSKDAQGNSFWTIKKASLPNNRIPPSAILIFNEPSFIEIPEGTFATHEGPNWILPTMHIEANSISQAQIISTLDMLNVNPYFRRISKLYQESKDRYASLIKR